MNKKYQMFIVAGFENTEVSTTIKVDEIEVSTIPRVSSADAEKEMQYHYQLYREAKKPKD